MSGRPRVAPLLAACLCMVAGCRSNGVEGGLDFERMVVQSKLNAYEPTDLFADGSAMLAPPAHAVPHENKPLDPVVRSGRRNGDWVARGPLGYTPELLRRGRDRFGVYCAPCHGFNGMAATPIARVMRLKPPPSLLDAFIRALPDGRIYGIIRDGYGLMPSYRNQLPAKDRWAVVAYVRALQLSQHVQLDSLAPAERDSVRAGMAAAGLPARRDPAADSVGGVP